MTNPDFRAGDTVVFASSTAEVGCTQYVVVNTDGGLATLRVSDDPERPTFQATFTCLRKIEPHEKVTSAQRQCVTPTDDTPEDISECARREDHPDADWVTVKRIKSLVEKSVSDVVRRLAKAACSTQADCDHPDITMLESDIRTLRRQRDESDEALVERLMRARDHIEETRRRGAEGGRE